MTAEVAILNKIGIAIAADSTVTVGDKTYNTTNKLFALSKYEPVGILIWGSTEMTSIPLETIIKDFRSDLGDRKFRKLSDYSNRFIRFLKTKVPISTADRKQNLAQVFDWWCSFFNDSFTSECSNQGIAIGPNALSLEAATIFKSLIDQLSKELRRGGRARSLTGVTEAELARLARKEAREAIQISCEPYILDTRQRKKLESFLFKGALSSIFSEHRTGFVITGYGTKDYFPHIISFSTDGYVGRKMKIAMVREAKISTETPAVIAPFAQRDAADLFMEGIDPTYNEYLEEGFSDLLVGIADVSARYFAITDKTKIAKLESVLKSRAASYINACTKKRRRDFVMPVLRSVQALDKSEMAALAENLVSLTALKQKVSLELETVGGPIDVAFISKHDGFIWIKRKHYFEADLNPFYFQRYLKAPV